MIFKNVQNGTHIFGIFWNQEPVRLDEPSQSFAIPDDVPEVSEYTIDPENAKAPGQTMIAADDLLHSFLKIIFFAREKYSLWQSEPARKMAYPPLRVNLSPVLVFLTDW